MRKRKIGVRAHFPGRRKSGSAPFFSFGGHRCLSPRYQEERAKGWATEHDERRPHLAFSGNRVETPFSVRRKPRAVFLACIENFPAPNNALTSLSLGSPEKRGLTPIFCRKKGSDPDFLVQGG